jgi:hypothetical protein
MKKKFLSCMGIVEMDNPIPPVVLIQNLEVWFIPIEEKVDYARPSIIH